MIKILNHIIKICGKWHQNQCLIWVQNLLLLLIHIIILHIPYYDPPIVLPLGFDPYAASREAYYDEGPEPLELELLQVYEPVYDLGPEWVPAPYVEHIPVYDASPDLQLLPEHIPIYGESPTFKIKLTASQYERCNRKIRFIVKKIKFKYI